MVVQIEILNIDDQNQSNMEKVLFSIQLLWKMEPVILYFHSNIHFILVKIVEIIETKYRCNNSCNISHFAKQNNESFPFMEFSNFTTAAPKIKYQ